MSIARHGQTHRLESLETRQHFAVTPGFPLTYGGGGFDAAQRVATDPSGNVIVAGLFSGTTNFNVQGGKDTLIARGDSDIYIAKYSIGGALIWVKQIGGDAVENEMTEFGDRDIAINPTRLGSVVGRIGDQPRNAGEYVQDMAVDASGNIIITGAFRKTISIGGLTLTPNQTQGDDFYDALVAKFDTNGNLSWTRNIGGPFDDVAMSVALDGAGNPFVGGYFTREADFDPSSRVYPLTTVGRDAGYVMRMTSGGALAWVYKFESEAVKESQRNAVNDLAVTPSGNVYLVGTFSEEVDFDPSSKRYVLEADDNTDAYVANLNRKGGLNWVIPVGGEGYDANAAIALDAEGNFYTAGYFSEEIDADPRAGKVNKFEALSEDDEDEFTDLLISKYAFDGRPIWQAQMGGEGYETIGDLRVAADGSVYTVGSYYGDADFAPGSSEVILSSAEVLDGDDIDDGNTDEDREDTYDFYISRLSPRGKYVDAASFGGADDDFASSIGVTADGALLLGGRATTARGDRDDRHEQSLIYLLNAELNQLS